MAQRPAPGRGARILHNATDSATLQGSCSLRMLPGVSLAESLNPRLIQPPASFWQPFRLFPDGGNKLRVLGTLQSADMLSALRGVRNHV